MDAGALQFEGCGGVIDGLIGQRALGIERFTALHALQFGVFRGG